VQDSQTAIFLHVYLFLRENIEKNGNDLFNILQYNDIQIIVVRLGNIMDKTTTVQARISDNLKTQAENILSGLGLNTSDAIRVFFHQIVSHGGLPFDMRIKQPNQKTQEALEELEKGGGIRHKNTSDMFKAWDKE
jgi:DNA-damage-inducible protein J